MNRGKSHIQERILSETNEMRGWPQGHYCEIKTIIDNMELAPVNFLIPGLVGDYVLHY